MLKLDMDFAPGRKFTRLDARITEEEGNFTVSVRMRNHRQAHDVAWGVETAATMEVASGMIGMLAAQFSIAQEFISIDIVMNNYRAGTFH